MEKDLTVKEAWLKETCRALFNQSLMAEQILGCGCESCIRTAAEIEIEAKTRFALQIITGCDEADALELVEEISSEETKKFLAEKNTEEARQHLSDSFKINLPNNNEEGQLDEI